ncbi:MAG: protein kinase [Verrucomicrobiota bacterium]
MPGNFLPELEAELDQTMRGVVGGTQLFNRFTLQKVLGRGGMGVVWLAQDERLDRLVALKLVPDAVCFDPAAHEDLKRETRKSLMLTHPNIVRIFDFIEEGKAAAISMEYVDGSTLSHLRVQKPKKCFEARELVPWLMSLCDALAYAHDSARLVHRDLKPSNLMVNSRSELKVADFGIACTLLESMKGISMRTSSGTLNYMSPQQMMGADPSPSDDIYSVGATLFELLASKPPFYGGDVSSQVRDVTAPTVAQRRAKFEIFGEPIPKYWEETIAACLAKNPERRPPSAAAIAQRLQLGGGTLRVSESGKEPTLVKLFSAMPKNVIAVAGAGLAVLVGLAIGFMLHRSPSAAIASDAIKSPPALGYATEVQTRPTIGINSIVAPPTKLASATQVRSAAAAPTRKVTAHNAALELTTTPAGATYSIYQGVIAGKVKPTAPPIRSGTAPESIENLSPGRYTIFFHNEGWPDDRTEVSLDSNEILPVDYTFPHGTATITSNPDGTEIFYRDHSVGHTPVTVDLPLGKQELVARHPDFPKRTKTVTIENAREAAVAFQLRSTGHSGPKPTPTPTGFGKLGNSLKKIFSAHPTPTPRKKR